MAKDALPNSGTPRPIGANADLVLKLFRKPEGFFFLLALIVEGMLFLIFVLGRTDTERMLALAGFLVMLFVLIVFFSRERGRAFQLAMQKLQPRAVPENMTAAPIKPEEAERLPNITTAPDGTFVYASPPPNWRVERTTLEQEMQLLFQQQGMGALTPEVSLQPYRAGPIVRFSEKDTHTLAYVPGKSLMNGRWAIGAFKEEIGDQVRMYSVSKRGGIMRDMPAEHVFMLVLGSMLQGGLKVEEIRFAPSEVDGLATLTGRGMMRVAHVMIDDVETPSAAVEARLHVVEYADVVYVIQTVHLDGGPGSDVRRAQIGAIVKSFRATTALDAAERAEKDAEEADKAYDNLASMTAPGILMHKASVLLAQMRRPGGLPGVSERQLEEAQMLEGYAAAFPNYVPDEIRATLAELRSGAQKAFDGQPAALAEFIALTEQDEEPGAAQLPAS